MSRVMNEFLTTKELSSCIKMAPGTLRNMVSNGTFLLNVHYVKPTPKKLLFVWPAIKEWLYNPGKQKIRNMSVGSQQRPQNGCRMNI